MLRGHPGVSLMNDLHTHGRPPNGGRPFYVGLTFLVLDDSMDELETVQYLVHHQTWLTNPTILKGPVHTQCSRFSQFFLHLCSMLLFKRLFGFGICKDVAIYSQFHAIELSWCSSTLERKCFKEIT